MASDPKLKALAATNEYEAYKLALFAAEKAAPHGLIDRHRDSLRRR
jgi:hypothetical protein